MLLFFSRRVESKESSLDLEPQGYFLQLVSFFEILVARLLQGKALKEEVSDVPKELSDCHECLCQYKALMDYPVPGKEAKTEKKEKPAKAGS